MHGKHVYLFRKPALVPPWNKHRPGGIKGLDVLDGGKMLWCQRILVPYRPYYNGSAVDVPSHGLVCTDQCGAHI